MLWCDQHFGPAVRGVKVSQQAHFPLADRSISLCVGLSVFTHIDSFESAWLAEIERVLEDRRARVPDDSLRGYLANPDAASGPARDAMARSGFRPNLPPGCAAARRTADLRLQARHDLSVLQHVHPHRLHSPRVGQVVSRSWASHPPRTTSKRRWCCGSGSDESDAFVQRFIDWLRRITPKCLTLTRRSSG